MTRKIAKTLEEAAQYQFEDALTISELKNSAFDNTKEHKILKRELDIVRTNVGKILNLLENDTSIDSKGFISQTKENTKDIEDLKDFKDQAVAKVSTAGVIILVVSSLIGWITNLILSK